MADAAFIWRTNIREVSKEIESGLARIRGSIQKASASANIDLGAGRDFGTEFGKGVEARIRSIAAQYRREMKAAALEVDKEMRKTGAVQGGVRGRVVGGVHTGPMGEARRRFEALAEEVNRALPPEMAGQRRAVQVALEQGWQMLANEGRAFYADIARDMRKLRTQLEVPASAARIDSSLARQSTTQADRLVQQAIARTPVVDDLDAEVARRSVLRSAPGVTDEQASQWSRVVRDNTQATREEIAVGKRLAAAIERQTAARSGQYDPEGVIQRGKLIQSQPGGRIYQETAKGAIPYEPENEIRRVNAERDFALQRFAMRSQQLQLEEQVQLERENTKALQARRNAAVSLTKQVEANRDQYGQTQRVGGAMVVGNVARDAEGRLFQFTDQGRGAVELEVGTKQRLAAQKAILAEDRRILAARERERIAAERAALAAQRGSVQPRPGIQGVFDRAFGGSGTGQGAGYGSRGLGFQDILTSGFSFARYLVSAAVFAAAYKGFNEVKTAMLDYADSLTDLQVALDNTEDDLSSFTNRLGDVSRFAGENPGAALDLAARGVRAFTDATATLAEQEEVGSEFAEAVGQLAVIAGKPLKDAGGDIIAISSAFDTSYQRVVDAIASAKKVGGDPSQIAQGLSSLAAAGQSAGYELEELASIISVVQARTDQTGQAAATRLARAFNVAGGTGRSALEQLNTELSPELRIDTDVALPELIGQLAEILPLLSETQLGRIKSSVGGTANSREFISLLQNYDEILSATEQSYARSGEGADEFRRQTENLRGEVKQIAGAFQSLVVQLADAQVFAAFGLVIETLEPVLTLTVRLLEAYNKLPTALKVIASGALQAAAAWKLLSYYKNATAQATAAEAAAETTLAGARARAAAAGIVFPPGYFGRGPGGTGAVAPPQTLRGYFGHGAGLPRTPGRYNVGAAAGGVGQMAYGAFLTRGQAGGGVAGVGPLLFSELRLGIRSAFTRFANFMTSGTGLALLGLGGAISIIQSYASTRNILDASDAGREAISGQVTTANIRDRIVAQEDAARELRESSSGFFGSLSNLLQGQPVERLAEDLDRQTANFKAAAEAFDTAQRESFRSGGRTSSLIDVTTPEKMAEGLTIMEDAGRTALQQLRALKESFHALGEGAEDASGNLTDLQQLEFTTFAGARLEQEFQKSEEIARGQAGALNNLFSEVFSRIIGEPPTEGQYDAQAYANLIAGRDIDQDRIRQITSDFLAATGGRLDRQDEVTLVNMIMEELQDQIPDLERATQDDFNAVRNDVTHMVRTTRSGLQQVVDQYASVAAFVSHAIQLIGQAAQQISLQASIFGGSMGGPLAGAQFELSELLELRRTGGVQGMRAEDRLIPEGLDPGLRGVYERQHTDAFAQIDVAILQAIQNYQEAVRNDIEAELSLTQAKLPPTDALGRIDAEIAAVKRQLEGFSDGTRITTDFDQIRSLEERLENLRNERSQAVLDQAQAARRAGVPVDSEIANAVNDLKDAQEQLDLIAASGDTSSQAYHDALRGVAEAQQRIVDVRASAAKESASAADDAARARLELAIAQIEAGVDPRSNLQQATAAIRTAELELQAAKRGTAEYYQALGDLNRAQIEYADAVIEAASLARQVAIDLTDPLAAAQEQLLTARQKLATAQSQGAPGDVLDQLRIEEKQAFAAAEAAAFQQRLSDVETARELGRISHTQYMQYLHEERERLNQIVDRTRQQQDHLDQIDKAIKAAAGAMSGQFNLGDIKIPTPYEARRAVNESLIGITGSTSRAFVDNRRVTITVNGGNLEEVRRVMRDAIGSPRTISPTGTGSRI